jgi:hypothetical protein
MGTGRSLFESLPENRVYNVDGSHQRGIIGRKPFSLSPYRLQNLFVHY